MPADKKTYYSNQRKADEKVAMGVQSGKLDMNNPKVSKRLNEYDQIDKKQYAANKGIGAKLKTKSKPKPKIKTKGKKK
jgi:hypothetical protein